MGILRWFDTTGIGSFAESVASDYKKLRHSVALRGDDAAKRAKRLEKVTQRVEEFNRQRDLNFYQRAKLLGDIKECLGRQGVDANEASAFVRKLLISRLA